MGQHRLLFFPSRRLAGFFKSQSNIHHFHKRIRHSYSYKLLATTHPPQFFPVTTSRILSSSASVSDDEFIAALANDAVEFGEKEDEEFPIVDVANAISQSTTSATRAVDERKSQDLLEALAQAIHDNVEAILTKQEQLNASNDNKQQKTLREKWKRIFDREKQMLRRRLRNSNPKEKVSVDELWDQALLAIHNNEALGHTSTNIHEASAVAEAYSPIFGLPMDDRQTIIEDYLDVWIADHLDEDEPANATFDDSEENTDNGSQKPKADTMFDASLNQDTRQERHFHEAILRSISLLSIMKSKDWNRLQVKEFITKVDRDNAEHDEMKKDSADGDEEDHVSEHVDSISVDNFDEEEGQHTLTTLQGNLLLAHLAVSTDADSKIIVDECFHIYNEMKLLGDSGQSQSQPDALTYRILILALNQRFMAPGEAIDLSQTMMKNETMDVTPAVFLEAMKACQAKMDLGAVRCMMDAVFTDRRVKPSLGSYLLFLDMLKASDLRTEALDFFRQLNDIGLLSREAEDKLLMSICRWPRTTRQGNFVDLSSFLLEVLTMVQKMVSHGKTPGLPVWMSLIDNMNISARKDPSLWNDMASTMQTILDLYPRSNLGQKLATTGLNASIFVGDPRIAATILQRVAHCSRPISQQNQVNDGAKRWDPPLIPFAVVKSAMDMCLQLSDTASAKTMIGSIVNIGNQYPKTALRELHSLLLLCHAKAGEPDKAIRDLKHMIEVGMKPGEDLYGAVLHSLVLAGRQDEADSLVRSMESGKDGMEVAPGTSSFDALLLGRVRGHDWDGAIGIYDTMKEKDIPVGPQTIQGLILAHQQRGGEKTIVSAVEAVLQNDKAQIREGVFRLIARMLFKEMDSESLDAFRQQVRAAGEQDPCLRDSSLQLVRSLRVAEIETDRTSSKHKSDTEMGRIQDQAWIDATKHLLEFFKAVSKDRID